jgi:antitoxin YefM
MASAAIMYSHARDHLAEIWDTVESTREPTIVRRRGHEDLAIVPVGELNSLMETAHLLGPPANAKRLFVAIARALAGHQPNDNPGRSSAVARVAFKKRAASQDGK